MPNVEVLEGDSGRLMPQFFIVSTGCAIFPRWPFLRRCDGRGELDTPICNEIDAILRLAPAGSFVVIDDARCFGTDSHYPDLADFL